MSDPFVINRLLDAPQALVWDVHTQPEHLAHWFGPKGSTVVKNELEFRVGGHYHYGLDFLGAPLWGLWKFVEITAPERLASIQCFSDEQGGATRHPMAPLWPLRTAATTTFTPQDGKTLVTLEWQPHEATPAEQLLFDMSHASMTAGWSGTFDVLEAYLTTLTGAGGPRGPGT